MPPWQSCSSCRCLLLCVCTHPASAVCLIRPAPLGFQPHSSLMVCPHDTKIVVRLLQNVDGYAKAAALQSGCCCEQDQQAGRLAALQRAQGDGAPGRRSQPRKALPAGTSSTAMLQDIAGGVSQVGTICKAKSMKPQLPHAWQASQQEWHACFTCACPIAEKYQSKGCLK